MKHPGKRSPIVRHWLDCIVTVSACLLLLSGCFVHRADVSDVSSSTGSMATGAANAPVEDSPISIAAAPVAIEPVLEETSKTPAVLGGWAVDNAGHKPADAVFITIDGKIASACRTTVSRPDVAKALGDPVFDRSGFNCLIGARAFPAGRHHIGIEIAVGGVKSFYAADFPTVIVAE